MRKAGLPITFHSLRQMHASALIAEGVDVQPVHEASVGPSRHGLFRSGRTAP